MPEQCDCTFVPNTYGLDFPIVLALIAPRPLLVCGGRKDPIFPPAGFRDAVRKASLVYDLYPIGGEDGSRIRLVESSSGHADSPEFLRECRRFMQRWLRPGSLASLDSAEDAGPRPEPPANLVCLRALPADAVNLHVHDVWIKTATDESRGNPGDHELGQRDLGALLRERVFRWFPAHQAAFKTRRLRSGGGVAVCFAAFGDFEFETEPGVRVRATVLAPRGQRLPLPVLIYVKGPLEATPPPDFDELLPLLPHTKVVILTPRFADRLIQPGDFARIERTAALTGRTVAALRVWDVMRAVEWAASEGDGIGESVSVYGRGESGVIGLYAAVFEPRIKHVILRDPPLSHRDGPAILTVMRHADLPEVASALAPRQLTLLGSRGALSASAFASTSRRRGSESIGTANSLAAAVLGRDRAPSSLPRSAANRVNANG